MFDKMAYLTATALILAAIDWVGITGLGLVESSNELVVVLKSNLLLFRHFQKYHLSLL